MHCKYFYFPLDDCYDDSYFFSVKLPSLFVQILLLTVLGLYWTLHRVEEHCWRAEVASLGGVQSFNCATMDTYRLVGECVP